MNKIPVEKNKIYEADIIDYGINGEGITKIDNYTIFVSDAIKGEKCKIRILKTLSSHAFSKIEEIIEKSPYRIIPDCTSYKRCGGCDLKHINYNETLNIKKEKVQNLVNSYLSNKIIVNNTIGMDNPYYYRNKSIFPVSIKNGNNVIGIFAKRTHEIIEFDDCKIQSKQAQEISKEILNNWNYNIYDENNNTGILKNIMVRIGFSSNEVMVVLIVKKFINYDFNHLIKKFPNIKTIVINVNFANTNVALSKDNRIIYGNGTIKDKINDYIFEISPNSFYQVNPIQTEKIYNLAIKNAKLNNNDIVYDLYCGVGTIGICLANKVKKVYGIEIIKEAIENAKLNAKLNNIQNIEFIENNVEDGFEELANKNIDKPNVIIVDPPRKGLDKRTIENILKLETDRLIYISCNPATMVRDIKILEEKYKINDITPIDNFPWTSHVECVSILSINNNYDIIKNMEKDND